MNLLFVTQGGYVRSFALLERAMQRCANLNRIGYYVSGREAYNRFLGTVEPDWDRSRDVLCEWDIMNTAMASGPPSDSAFDATEREFADPTFWNALLCDRRVYYGKKCVFTQDYAPRFTHEELLAVAHTAIRIVKAHVERVKPEAILSFINVTFGEYCYYLVACRFGIPYLNLRNTKVDNYLTASLDIFEPSQNIVEAYQRLSAGGQTNPEHLTFARSFVASLASTRVTYEGQGYLSKKEKSLPAQLGIGLTRAAFGAASAVRNRFHRVPPDNQTPDPFISSWYNGVVKPLRYHAALRRHRDRMITAARLPKMDYAFYPLHLEPEISLLTYSRPYLNQIEVLRWLSLALPTRWKLVVKDHPKNPEYRSLGFYRKLFEIPNVLLLPHATSTFEIIRYSRLVTTISGFVGFEALCQGKPVVALGKTAFEFLPEAMYRRVDDPHQLPQLIADLLKSHAPDFNSLVRFANAVVSESVRCDWYSIGQQAGLRQWKDLTEFENLSGYKEQFANLADYLLNKIDELTSARQ